MTILKALFYGIIQGLTEFLPVSSSGHLSIIQNIFHTSNLETDYFTFDILLHLATLVAVIIVYRHDVAHLIVSFFTLLGKLFHGKFRLKDYTPDERFVIFVIIATLPLIPVVFFKDSVELLYAQTKLIGVILIFNGVMLFVSDRISKGGKDLENTTPMNALAVGLCQMCAVLPGLSRSGATITGGRLCGFNREYAVRFSFILSIPAILGANIFNIPDLITTPVPSSDIPAYIIGMLAAALTGIAAMKLLAYISKKANFTSFSVYCVLIGALALIFG